MQQKMIDKTMYPHNEYTNHISISYNQYYALLQGEIEGFHIYSPSGNLIKSVAVSKETAAKVKPRKEYFLLDYSELEEV